MTEALTMEPGIRGALGDEAGDLPLIAVDITATISGLVATTVMRQTFRNTRDTGIEATYIFPLPDRAGVTSFIADLAGRKVVATLQERAAARQQYNEAIEAGHRAAIAEEERPGVFTMRVGNLQPNEEAVLELTLTGPVAVDNGDADYRFPLVVAPRYVSGQPLEGGNVGTGIETDTDAVPDASRISPPVLLPGQESPVALSMTATFDTAVAGTPAMAAVTSSLHAVNADTNESGFTVALRPGERLDSDVVLRWSVADQKVVTSAVVVPDADDATSGTWMVSLVAPRRKGTARGRDVVIALDRSGSMGGWKMVAARRAAARIVDSLTSKDRFQVLAFDTDVISPFDDGELPYATDANRWRAVEWLARIEARGGTEMLYPLTRAVDALDGAADAKRERYIMLVTDGQTAGEEHILGKLTPRLGDTRVFTLGIDKAVNAGFLRRLAGAGGGRCELVESEDRLDAVMATLHRRIAAPVARDISVAAHGGVITLDSITPGRQPDLFDGSLCVVSGRITGLTADASVQFTVTGDGFGAEIDATAAADAAVRTIWARAHIRDLEDAYISMRGEARTALAERITAVSLESSVLSRFTAYVAVDDSRTVEGAGMQGVTQPVEMPAGWAKQAAAGGYTVLGKAPAPLSGMTGERSLKRSAGPLPFDLLATGTTPSTAHPFDLAASAPAGRASLQQGKVTGSDVPADTAPPFALTPGYTARIDDLLKRVIAGSDDVTALVAELDELASDLESTGATADLVDALRALSAAVAGGGDIAQHVTALGLAVEAAGRPRAESPWWRN